MSSTSTQIKESLERELKALTTARDELKLQMHLAKAEAHAEWSKLEAHFSQLQDELKRASGELKAPVKELGNAGRGLLDELKQGYTRIRNSLKT